MDATATHSQTSPNPHRTSPVTKPKVYKVAPAVGSRVFMTGKYFRASSPSFMILKYAGISDESGNN
jgi:hypothetical protein